MSNTLKNSFLFFLLTLLTLFSLNGKTDTKYLESVAQIEGNIVFQKTIPTNNKSAQQLYQQIHNWLTNKCVDKASNNILLYTDADKQLAARLQEQLIFKHKGLILDDAIMQYVLIIQAFDDNVQVKIQNIVYDYHDKEFKKDLHFAGKWIPAESIISDGVCMDKKKSVLYKPYDKFRIFTIDAVDRIFDQLAQTCVGTPTSVITRKQNADSLIVIAGTPDALYLSTPIEFLITDNSDGSQTVTLQLNQKDYATTVIDDTRLFTLSTFDTNQSLLLSSLSRSKQFTIDQLKALGLQPVVLKSANVGISPHSKTISVDEKLTDKTNKFTVFKGHIVK